MSDYDYDGGAWARGPQLVYDRLAEQAVDLLQLNTSSEIAGCTALDVGAGTGAMTRALLQRGARVDAADTSPEMLAELRRQTGDHVRTTIADICSLPVADGTYDITAAGFVVNHLHNPAAAVRELARVTVPEGVQVATSFLAEDPPVKLVIDEVLRRHGWQPPDWYVEAKAQTMPLTATIEAFVEVAEAAGLHGYQVHRLDVEFADLDAAAVTAYRLGMAHTAPFIAALAPDQRDDLTGDCVVAAATAPPLALAIVVLLGGV